MLVARLTVIDHVWREANKIYSADLLGIDALPRGARLAVAMPAGTIHMLPIPEAHFPTLAIVRREAFVPTLFADPDQQPIVLTPPFAVLAEATPPPRVWAAVVDGDLAQRARLLSALEQYDFVAVIDNRPIYVPPSRCLASIYERESFQIFTILHGPSCADHEH